MGKWIKLWSTKMITIWISVSRSQEYLWNFKKKKTRKREKKKEVAQHLGQILSASVGFIAVPRDFHFRDDSSRGLSCQDNVLFFTAVLPWRSSAFTSPCSRRERGIVSKMKVLKKRRGRRISTDWWEFWMKQVWKSFSQSVCNFIERNVCCDSTFRWWDWG